MGKMLQAIAMPPLNLCGGMARRRSRVLMRPLGWTVTSMKKSVLMRAKVQKVKLTEVFQKVSILLEDE